MKMYLIQQNLSFADFCLFYNKTDRFPEHYHGFLCYREVLKHFKLPEVSTAQTLTLDVSPDSNTQAQFVLKLQKAGIFPRHTLVRKNRPFSRWQRQLIVSYATIVVEKLMKKYNTKRLYITLKKVEETTDGNN